MVGGDTQRTSPTAHFRNTENQLHSMKTMNRLSSLKPRAWLGLCLAIVVAAVYTVSIAFAGEADPKAKTENKTKPEKKAVKKPDGAALYATHCNRCHAERYATERTDAQWKTIMLHMQTRAQLPGKDAKAILKYLQENN
jgi:mono/diheme cytochrome c family protein